MMLGSILGLIITILIIGMVYVAVAMTPNDPETLTGERRRVMYKDKEFEFRFWDDEYFGPMCGVFIPRTPDKVLWKEVNRDICIARSFGIIDPVDWCYKKAEEYYTDSEEIRKGEQKLKAFLNTYPAVEDNKPIAGPTATQDF